MAVRHEDDVHGTDLVGVGRGPMAFQRPEAVTQERVGQDPDPVDLEEHGGVPDVPDGDLPLVRRRHALSCVATTTGSLGRPGT
jgi:hypothetical protein